MIKGTMEMKLSHDTLVDALQAYLNVQFAEGKAPKVLSITQGQYNKEFTVQTQGETSV